MLDKKIAIKRSNVKIDERKINSYKKISFIKWKKKNVRIRIIVRGYAIWWRLWEIFQFHKKEREISY